MDYQTLLDKQKAFYNTHKTKDIKFRLDALKRLYQAIVRNEHHIKEALRKDLGKSHEESFVTEIGVVLSDLSYAIKHLKQWAKPKRVKTPLMLFKGVSYRYFEPYGVTLILSPWNYPFQLCINPLVGALAAGNTAILKPSSSSPHVSQVIHDLIKEAFEDEYVSTVLGSSKEADALLYLPTDYIFFTGSIQVGKHVMEVASQNLIPVTLELGGKSPCIVDETVDLKVTAKRIAFGKLINAGQTCIAPDYLLIKKSLKNEFVTYYKEAVTSFYGENPLVSPHYPKIINEKHVERLKGLMEGETIVLGGKSDGERIEPTLLDNITFNSKVMQEEIFGPILPMITYESIEEVLNLFQGMHKPLAFYLFTNNKKIQKKVLNEAAFGGATINDTLMHFVNHHLGFGGVGYSGFGAYHGKKSFETFSHEKAVIKRGWFELPFRYHPLTPKKEKLLKKFLK